MFRFYYQNGMPAVAHGVSARVPIRTASEIEAERRAKKGLPPKDNAFSAR